MSRSTTNASSSLPTRSRFCNYVFSGSCGANGQLSFICHPICGGPGGALSALLCSALHRSSPIRPVKQNLQRDRARKICLFGRKLRVFFAASHLAGLRFLVFIDAIPCVCSVSIDAKISCSVRLAFDRARRADQRTSLNLIHVLPISCQNRPRNFKTPC